jgi:hypothetical protein
MAPSMNMIAFWYVAPCSLIIAQMMEAVRASETSVYFNETAQHYIPEG